MNPSSLRIRANSSFILERGMSTDSCFTELALRTRVNISAIGSVITIQATSFRVRSLPARFGYSGNLPFISIFPEADAAHLKTAHVTAGPPADSAAVYLTHLKLWSTLRLGDHRFLGHYISPFSF